MRRILAKGKLYLGLGTGRKTTTYKKSKNNSTPKASSRWMTCAPEAGAFLEADRLDRGMRVDCRGRDRLRLGEAAGTEVKPLRISTYQITKG